MDAVVAELNAEHCRLRNFKALQPIDNISWWLQRCPLNIRAKDADTLNQILNAPPTVSDKLTSLYLGKREMNPYVPVSALYRLEKLSVAGDSALLRAVDAAGLKKLRTLRVYRCAEDTYAILCRIPSLQHLFIEGMEVSMPSMRDLDSAESLVQLTVVTSTLGNMSGFDVCANLRHVRFHYCSFLESLSALAAAPRRQSIGVYQLKGPAACPELEVLDLIGCKSLRRFSTLAGASPLKSILVQGSDVDDIGGLASCSLLQTLNSTDCMHLVSLAPLAGAPQIRHIFAAGTDVQDVTGLASCPFLKVLDVSYCFKLTTLAPLASSPHLNKLLAGGGSIVSVIDGLATCVELATVDFSGCINPESLAELPGAPSLTTIFDAQNAVSTIDNIGSCSELQTVDFKYCPKLHSFAPLATAPKLHCIVAAKKLVAHMECPAELPPLIKEKA